VSRTEPVRQCFELALSTWLGLSGIGACRGRVQGPGGLGVGGMGQAAAVSPVTSFQTASSSYLRMLVVQAM